MRSEINNLNINRTHAQGAISSIKLGSKQAASKVDDFKPQVLHSDKYIGRNNSKIDPDSTARIAKAIASQRDATIAGNTYITPMETGAEDISKFIITDRHKRLEIKSTNIGAKSLNKTA